MWRESHDLFAQGIVCFDGSGPGLNFTSEEFEDGHLS